MHFLGTSFRVRLITGALIWIVVILCIGWFVLTGVFHRYAVGEFASELDHHATELTNLATIGADGRLAIWVPLSDHRFMEAQSGFYWQLERPNGETLRSTSLGNDRLALALDFAQPGDQRTDQVAGPTGDLLLLERVVTLSDQKALRVAVGTDVRLIDEFLAETRHILELSLVALALGMVGATFAQVAYGLRPFESIRQAVLAVRLGEASRLPEKLPDEVAPLAASVNALLAVNEQMVRRAQIQAGNLAHSLKTPLALLLDEGRRLVDAGHNGRLVIEQCERMRRQIDYQLAKTRAIASQNAHFGVTRLGPAIQDIVSAIDRLNWQRSLKFEVMGIDPQTVVACGAEDFDEILGNLVDNAAKWARTRIRIVISPQNTGFVHLSVEDDGPGMPPEARDRVFEAGERLDELKAGSGLGLAIVRDVVAVYGGRTWIGESELGGAAVHVELPARRRLSPELLPLPQDSGID